MLAWLHGVDRGLAAAEKCLVILLLASLLGIGLMQVCWRNLLASGLPWADELLQHCVLWLGLLGASLATYERRHLSIDILGRLCPPAWQPRLHGVTDSAACLICLLLTYAAWRFVAEEYLAGTVLTFGVSSWLAQSILPVSCLTMALRFALGVGQRLLAGTQSAEGRG